MLNSFLSSQLDLLRQKIEQVKPRLYAPQFCIVARLKIVDKDFWIDGAVLELTPQRALFREASHYLFKRHNEEVLLELETDEIPARIVSTGVYGYELEFFHPLALPFVNELCDRWQVEA